ncbi:hypothetical protein NDU88_004982 [Pleurodeles waltl]|uniref:Uncharacterized protein n=1 Tax=Pleurodeles waltl TaxID=8319 RepID=A0AAV7QDQ5_PLEWA|nr:hypothetical protein NDU88_004982 [Pleurodeles waltl]
MSHDRSRKLLAWLVQEDRQFALIGVLRLDDGMIITTPSAVNAAFYEYYQSLCTAPVTPAPERVQRFFRALPLGRLTPLLWDVLDGPLEVDKIRVVLKQIC